MFIKLVIIILFLSTAITCIAQTTAEEWFNKAEKYATDGDAKKAIDSYTKAIELKENYYNAFFRRGFAYTLDKQYDNAIADYTRVIKEKPDFIWAYISRGSAYNKLKKFNEGLQDFNKALGLDPKNQEAYNNRGWSKKGLGNDKAACDDWKQSKKLGNEEAKLILKNQYCK